MLIFTYYFESTMTHIKYLFFFLAINSVAFAQNAVEVTAPDYIKTIVFKSNTNQGQLPIFKLNEKLTLEFDALTADEGDFYYEIEHYNYDWTKSRLLKSEYMQGYDSQRIVNYENSFNTYQIYSHYTLELPNKQTKLRVTGNYLMKIYDDYGELMFSRKFMIYEDLATVGVAIKRSRDVSFIEEKQSVNFKINAPNLRFINPEQTVKTLIIQNNNLNTAISGLKPQYTIGNELIYKYDKESSFWGGNEYLFFENKNIRGANVGVQFIDLQDIYHSYLFANTPRAERPYTYNPDINGNFLITALDTDVVEIEADYTVVHFALEYPETLNSQSIHVYGNFNGFAIEDSTKLEYNSKSGYYETSLTLKQGFYNYKYVIVNENGTVDEGAISGNFDYTENEYKVLVYYRELGGRYDKIIGIGEASSINITN